MAGTLTAIHSARSRYTDRPRINSEDPFFLSVPVVIYPVLWIVYGIFMLRGLQRGAKWGERLALVRIWLTLPLILIHLVVMFVAGLILWPHLDSTMLSIFLYVATEVCFLIAGILVWRSRKATRAVSASQ